MGGFGSGMYGRIDAKDKVEERRKFDIREILRKKILVPGNFLTTKWSRQGRVHASIGVHVYTDYLLFDYTSNNKPYKYRIDIEYTDTNFNGKRAWMKCPHCGKRVAVVYLLSNYFVCRECANLNYESTGSNGRLNVLQHKIDRIAGKLKMENNFDIPKKPKGMHWSTFNRLCNELRLVTNQSFQVLGDKYNYDYPLWM